MYMYVYYKYTQSICDWKCFYKPANNQPVDQSVMVFLGGKKKKKQTEVYQGAGNCETCKKIVRNLQKGILETSKSNFGGGNTDWEEEKLGSYAFRFPHSFYVNVKLLCIFIFSLKGRSAG